MRNVLTAAIALGATLVLSATPSEASHYSVSVSVYHPTGNASYSAVLTCGWHDICDGNYPDSTSKGLDWVWPSNVSYSVSLRLFVVSSLSSQTQVGTVRTRNGATGCYRIEALIYRTDGAFVGSVINQHALVSTNKSYNIFGREQGIYSDTPVGSMVLSDNCYSEGPHTMQWSTVGSKNQSIPTEGNCVLCNKKYGVWMTREYVFSYLGP